MKKKRYTFDEAYQPRWSILMGDELAAKVWVSKYALKDSQGEIYEKTLPTCTAAWQVRWHARTEQLIH